MGEKGKLNTKHPDCAEYTAKFKAIWDAYSKKEEEEESKYPDWRGQDHPADAVLRPLHRECCRQTKALQEEYSYLWEEE